MATRSGGRGRGRIEKLLKVVVAGGVAMAAGCATVPKSGDAPPPQQGDPQASPPPKPASPPSGVRGW